MTLGNISREVNKKNTCIIIIITTAYRVWKSYVQIVYIFFVHKSCVKSPCNTLIILINKLVFFRIITLS